MRQMTDLARSFGARVVPHSFYWGPGYLATAHIIAAMPQPALLETVFVNFETLPHPLMDPMQPTVTLPESPGLGFEPDLQALKPYVLARRTVSSAR